MNKCEKFKLLFNSLNLEILFVKNKKWLYIFKFN